MVISRRSLMLSLLAAPAAARLSFANLPGACPPRDPRLPAVENLAGGGRSALTEGETLLVEIVLPDGVRLVEGSFPVTITPDYTGGEPLVEPQPLFFFPAADGGAVRTILSAPLDSGGQRAVLRLSGLAGGGPRAWAFDYESLRGAYRRSSLTLSRATSEPSPDVAEQRRRDFETNVAIYRGRSPRQWSDTFVPAVPLVSRRNFGLRRTVNGTLHYRHTGLDYPAPVGTPVRAMNAGRVALSGEQWTPGQIVILDHGGGIFSRYIHLSRRLVEEGERVERGQVIALSGNTGGQRPAPHLHLDTVINGTPVSPHSLMESAALLLARERGA